MIEFKKKIVTSYWTGEKTSRFAKHYGLGTKLYDGHGKMWEVGEDINFDHFWFREIEDKNAELVVKGFRKDD